MYIQKRNLSPLDRIKKATTTILIFFIILECIIFPSLENIFGCVAELYGWLLISRTIFKEKYIYRYFIPFITLFCYAYSFFVLPIGVTLIEGKPITFRFAVPYITFFNLILNATTIVLAFHTCKCIYKEGWLTSLWKKMGYFRTPTDLQIWAFGFLGLAALFWSASMQGSEEMNTEKLGIIGQFLMVLRNFAFIPIVLLFPQHYGKVRSNSFNKVSLILYLVLLSIIAIATTKRAILFNMVTVWAVMTFFISILEKKKLFSNKILVYLIFGFYLITGPLADMAIAMSINRMKIYSSNSSTTFSDIMKIYSDKEELHKMYKIGTFSNTDNNGDNYSQWSEYYIDNIFFDRFCNLRTQDITLDYATKLGYGSKRMQDYAEHFFLFLIPSPILNTMGYSDNKFEYNYTPADLLSTDALGLNQQYNGFRVCGDSGAGLAWLGYPYYIIAFFIYIALFYFLTSLVSIKREIIIPIPVIMSMMIYMNYFNNSTGIFKTIHLLLRDGWQSIIIYCVIMWILRKIFR